MSSLDIKAYKVKREALIDEDRSLRRENIWKSQRSAAEIKADERIRNLRAYEASTVWKVESDSIPHPFPGMEFLNGTAFPNRGICPHNADQRTGRNIIVKTKIYQILSKAGPACHWL